MSDNKKSTPPSVVSGIRIQPHGRSAVTGSGQPGDEGGALSEARFYEGSTTVPLDHSLGDGQSHARSRIGLVMDVPEDPENAVLASG